MITKVEPKYDVGVLVGRFQVDELHDGHKKIIEYVLSNHHKVIVFLGVSPLKCTIKNPLDFEARKQMIVDLNPNINVLYIKDQPSDETWSKNLDSQIRDLIGPSQTVVLYGGRDSFIKCYTGKYPTSELMSDIIVSGSQIRDNISNTVKASSDFRKGVIWATCNQYPKCYTTVDIAIVDSEKKKVLLARKPNESLYRFVGGFVDPGETLEHAANREVIEETGLEVANIEYLTSFVQSDWRYRSERDKITTAFFRGYYVFGSPTPKDDICELRWFTYQELIDIRDTDTISNCIEKVHHNLFNYFVKVMV